MSKNKTNGPALWCPVCHNKIYFWNCAEGQCGKPQPAPPAEVGIEVGSEVIIIGPNTKGDDYHIGYPESVKVEQIHSELGVLVGDDGWNDWFPASSLSHVPLAKPTQSAVGKLPDTIYDVEEFMAVTRSGESYVNADGFPVAKVVNHETAEFIAASLNSTLAKPAASPGTGDGWRAIDSAPLNESILVYIPNTEHYGEGIYRAMHVDMGTGKRWMTTGVHCGRDLGASTKPTHWMPLPPAPVVVQEREVGT